jgi:hypothetical protein
VNLGGRLAFIGWCAAEAPNQQAEEVIEVGTVDMLGGEGMALIPDWMREAAHPKRPAWHVVSAYAPSGAFVCAQVVSMGAVAYRPSTNAPDFQADCIQVRAVDGEGKGVNTTVLVRVRCATAGSLEPWQDEPDPRRRAASLAFHAKSRRHDRA